MVMFCWFFQAFLFGVPHSFVSSTRILLFYVFSCICFSFPTITANGFLKYGIIRTISKTNSLNNFSIEIHENRHLLDLCVRRYLNQLSYFFFII